MTSHADRSRRPELRSRANHDHYSLNAPRRQASTVIMLQREVSEALPAKRTANAQFEVRRAELTS